MRAHVAVQWLNAERHVHAIEGTFSSVYKAIDVHHYLYDNRQWSNVDPYQRSPVTVGGKPPRNRYVALKRIYVTSSPSRILNELEIMAKCR